MRRNLVWVVSALLIGCAPAEHDVGSPDAHGHGHGGAHHVRFEDADHWATIFENPDRDEWQRPADVLEFLQLRPDDIVADIGAATGYFPVRFARAVPRGKVYGIDIEKSMVRYLDERAKREGIRNLRGVHGKPNDPKIPGKVDEIFVCNTYHHIERRPAYFRKLIAKLNPGGTLTIVDFLPGELPVGPPPDHKIASHRVIAELRAAGYKLIRADRETLPFQYMLRFTPVTDPVRVTPANFHATWNRLLRGADELPTGTKFELAPGRYQLRPKPYREERCGNCEDPATPVNATVGLAVSGEGIVIAADTSGGVAEFVTRAGYGILFEECHGCSLVGVGVTGGKRDLDANATNAAVVVKESHVDIEDCHIHDNVGEPAAVRSTVVGIMGITGREGASIGIRRNRIVRNSWDAVALYRGASAVIEENRIDGVDKASGQEVGGGRGVAVGVTWDAEATVTRNHISRYWKGIGCFVDAKVTAHENVVEEILTWGISLWDAGRGKPSADIRKNVIFDTGACGISITRSSAGDPHPGRCRNNVVARTGQNPSYDSMDFYCRQLPISIESLPAGFDIGSNYFYANRRFAEALMNDDLTKPEFAASAGALLRELEAIESLRGARAFRELPRR